MPQPTAAAGSASYSQLHSRPGVAHMGHAAEQVDTPSLHKRKSGLCKPD
jgi:hypothetical protein